MQPARSQADQEVWEKDAELSRWIRENTEDADTVVELGACLGVRLKKARPQARKIGIEIFPAYASAFPVEFKLVIADMRNWDSFISHHEADVCMLIDSLEHIPKVDGQLLLQSLQTRFRRILVFTPDGFVEQTGDIMGHENPWQEHDCGWSADELIELGFSVTVDPDFHENYGALFAVWNRE